MTSFEQRPEKPILDDGTELRLDNTTTFFCDKTGDAQSVVTLLKLAANDSAWTITTRPAKFGGFSAVTVTTVLSGVIQIAIYLGEWPTILIEELVGLYHHNPKESVENDERSQD